ncbi:MAG: lytic transglycosylase domain-containing protein, partial [Gemmatimonadales bacterium]
RRKWVRVVALVAGVAAVGLSVMGFIIWRQQQEIDRLLARKGAIDKEIAAMQEEMQVEQDSTRLEELEGMLTTLTGSAERTLEKLSEADEAKAVAAAQGTDELDREIRRILASVNASTYAIPPIFRERLQYHIDEMMKAKPTVRAIYARKQKYWPMIIREFDALGLPEEMAYVAWQESKFDPVAECSAGAKGLWQMTAGTARSYGLEVDDSVDERTDPDKQTRAAARYLANLLAEFGEDSFMLAMAAYNRGESGVRRVLHQIAAEPGGFKKNKRDFWHLYRMKKLPEETREYVPKILAAAIVASNPEKYGIGK